jgi:hypothetical protein
MVWVAGPGRLAVQCQLTFNHIRSWMIQGVMQYAKSPEAMILPDMPEMAGPRMIEKHIKPASFSIANPKLPSQGPPTKKPRINLNTPPNSFNQQKNRPAFGRGRGGGRYSGGNSTGGRYASGQPKGPRAYSQQQGRPGDQGGNHQFWNSPSNNWTPQSNTKQQNSPITPHQERTLAPGQRVCGMFGQTSTGKEPVYLPTTTVVVQDNTGSPLKPRLLSFLDN